MSEDHVNSSPPIYEIMKVLTKENPFEPINMGVSKNRGTPKSSILIGFSIIFTIHFGVPLIFGNIHI